MTQKRICAISVWKVSTYMVKNAWNNAQITFTGTIKVESVKTAWITVKSVIQLKLAINVKIRTIGRILLQSVSLKHIYSMETGLICRLSLPISPIIWLPPIWGLRQGQWSLEKCHQLISTFNFVNLFSSILTLLEATLRCNSFCLLSKE